MTKKTYIILIVVGLILSIFYFALFNKSSSSIRAEGILIYDKWEGYIYSKRNQDVWIQLPLYDFSNLLEEGYSVSVDNFDIGEVRNIELEQKHQYDDFTQYILHINFVPTISGEYNIDDITVNIETPNKKYSDDIGNWVFEVSGNIIDDMSPISVVGGSILTNWTDYYDEFEYRSSLQNNSEDLISIEEININHKLINIKKIDKIDLEPGQKIQIGTIVDVSETDGNVYIQPKLTYKFNDELYTLPLNYTIHASSVPIDELYEIIDKKGMVK